MRGRNSAPVPYCCEEDRALAEEEQTIFWLICKNNSMANVTVRRYTRARRDTRDGGTEYDPRLLDAADIDDFLAICSKVENYAWSLDYLAKHPQMESKVNGRGFYEDAIVDATLLADVARDLPAGVLSELFDASISQVRLNRGAKKGWSSLSGSLSGSQRN